MFQAVRHSILTWLGICGGALTLVSNLQGILDLAQWANWLTAKWSALITPLISGLVGLSGIQVTAGATAMIAMAIFVSTIAIGARVENQFRQNAYEDWPIRRSNLLNIRVLLGVVVYIADGILVALALSTPTIAPIIARFPYGFIIFGHAMYCVAIIIGLRGWPLWCSLMVAACMLVFSYIFGYSVHAGGQSNVSEAASIVIAGAFAVICGLIVVMVAPPLAFTKRLVFMIVGVLFVLALSRLSQLGVSATP
ncbi:hypothetical protein C5748_24105 [Phyllobacterium phragmitis]|uniref:Uncharacterized protein n=1 Tax=Phyllobacterium phragmitis TaxID=2670329 RepID=A0A2S9IKB0_9HYPH|nr:hypothetical protein [Phyllobacterium phragmitis]PRD40949.1 hypothetical protein C5748_24105 [Phyllobacterium phragmitis]